MDWTKIKRFLDKCIIPLVLCVFLVACVGTCLTGCQGLANANGHDNTVIVARETVAEVC